MELIFVDDGSGDESMIELMKIKHQRPDTRVVKLTRNFGEIHSCKMGLNYVTGDCIMWLSADLQDPPELVIEMTDQWLAGSKFVIALRESRQDPPVTTLFAGIYHWLVRKMINKDYPKGGIDILLMDAALVPYIRGSSKNVNTELLAYWLGYKPATVPYDRRKRITASRAGLSEEADLFHRLDPRLLGAADPDYLPARFHRLAAVVRLRRVHRDRHASWAPGRGRLRDAGRDDHLPAWNGDDHAGNYRRIRVADFRRSHQTTRSRGR